MQAVSRSQAVADTVQGCSPWQAADGGPHPSEVIGINIIDARIVQKREARPFSCVAAAYTRKGQSAKLPCRDPQVFLVYAAPISARTPIGPELYVPRSWTQDQGGSAWLTRNWIRIGWQTRSFPDSVELLCPVGVPAVRLVAGDFDMHAG